jgi:hypothetical protein
VTGLFGAFLFETALVTYRAVTQGQVVTRKGKQSTAPLPAPLPSLYTSAIIVYGVLGLAPSSVAPLPALIGWGFVVATFLNVYTPGSANAGKASNVEAVQGLTTTPPKA